MNDWRWNGNGSLYENLLLILNGVSTTLTSILLQKVLARLWIFFWAMLDYLPIYDNLKNLVSVFTSVFFSSGHFSSFKFRYFFVTLLISLVENWLLLKIFVKFSKSLIKTYPCIVDFVTPIQQSFNEIIFYFEGVKLKKFVNKPVYVGFL